MTKTAAGMRRGPTTPNRHKIEALIPTDKGIRKALRGQWHSPNRTLNRVPLRYIDENSKKQYFVTGWNGGNTVSVMCEGKYQNLSLTTLARRRVKLDMGWNPETRLSELFEAKELPAPILTESELKKSEPRWVVCKGIQRNLTEHGDVVHQEVWGAYRSIDDAPITMVPVGKTDAPDRATAVQLVQEEVAKKTLGVKKSSRHVNYSSRRGGVQTINEMIGLNEGRDDAWVKSQTTPRARKYLRDAASGKMKGPKTLHKHGQTYGAHVGRQMIAETFSMEDLARLLRYFGLDIRDFKKVGKFE